MLSATRSGKWQHRTDCRSRPVWLCIHFRARERNRGGMARQNTAQIAIDDLGRHGRKLWDRVMAEYQIEDSGGLEMLAQACQALNRAEALREEIDRDGEVFRVRGSVREHPTLKVELANRAFVVRTLAKLGLNFEPVRPASWRPSGFQGVQR